ncbi:MAG: hypothetical protein KKE62_01175 [Proteobacteria bacterium]|nr:hypothetical protein [Pseudomonadota bacterium]MBU1386863.1 hypothetical protein [Pseudomonadota bacterium]MBU1541430.1 hypothetical protein [Pseudomonadota bacterium]MBU2429421.1 hypothetical protein [Pseudomonadota bacterium]MBU2480038.1 hypothetical protein [Pseudomonadota bacterium]
MKRILRLIVRVIILTGFATACSASPLSDIMSLFQRDLVIDVVYADHKNLIQESRVYMATDPQGQKILIGKVNKISLTDTQQSKVEISIDKEYKEKMHETTAFVLMSASFSENSEPYIVAVPPLDVSNKKLLERQSQVKGVTFLEYKIAVASESFNRLMERIKKQNTDLLKQLENYINSFNTNAFQKKMDELTDQISEFSIQQKEVFKKEVLPSLQKMFDSLKEQNTEEKSKELEKQLREIENLIDV